jgi:hypothetical protein
MRSYRLHLVLFLLINDLRGRTRRGSRTESIESITPTMETQFRNVEDRVNGERGGKSEFVGDRGNLAANREGTDPSCRQLGCDRAA